MSLKDKIASFFLGAKAKDEHTEEEPATQWEKLKEESAETPSFAVEDPALIEKLLAVHQTVIDHRKELKSALDACRTDVPRDSYFRNFKVEYVLQDGRTLRRDYELIIFPADLDDPDSVASALYGLVSDPVFNRLNYGLDGVEADRLTEVAVCGLEGAEKGEVVFYSPLSEYAGYDNEGSSERPELPPQDVAAAATRSEDGLDLRPAATEELAALLHAVEADFNAGNLGRRWLFADNDGFNANTCTASLEFCWNKRSELEDGEVFYSQRRVDIQLTPQAANTLAALEELGLFENGAFISNYDDERVYPQ